MANIKSAEKRIKVTKRNTLQNRIYLSKIKTFTKTFLNSLEIYKKNPTVENQVRLNYALSNVYSNLDKAIKKNVIHKNKAARKKSSLKHLILKLNVL